VKRKHIDGVKRFLEELGVHVVGTEYTGGGHIAFICEKGGMQRKIVTGMSPGDRRSLANIQRSVRKVFS